MDGVQDEEEAAKHQENARAQQVQTEIRSTDSDTDNVVELHPHNADAHETEVSVDESGDEQINDSADTDDGEKT